MAKAETAALTAARLLLSRRGYRLLRNQVGVARYRDRRGRQHVVPYGLCRGSADYIGWRPVTIGPEHVGQTLAQFVALEGKANRGVLSAEQHTFLTAVARAGGEALVARPGAVEPYRPTES